MKRLIYLFPILINYILGGMFFINAYRFSEAGCGSVVVGAALGAWALAYCLISPVAGRITRERNAAKLILAGVLMLAAAAVGFLVFDGLYTQFVWIVLSGVGAAFYCTPFQVFMRSLEPPGGGGVVRATSLYTFSWSFGMASGPFIFGLFSARTGYTVNLILALAIGLGVIAVARRSRSDARGIAAEPVPEASGTAATGAHDFAPVGWLVGGVGVLTVCQIRSMWPFRGAELAISKTDIGLVLALVSYIQAFTALALIRSRNWMTHPGPALAVGGAGVAGLLTFAFARTVPWFIAGAAVYAVYAGCFYFYLVYHALADPRNAPRNVAVNETVVGIASIAGPVLGGWAARADGSPAPFWMAAVLTAAAAAVQYLIFRRAGKK